MGTAVRPANTSPGSWDTFADVDVFVDAVLAELAAMAGSSELIVGHQPSIAEWPTQHPGLHNVQRR